MNVMELTCTCCPLGCPITVAKDENGSYEYRAGALCGRGQKYAVLEASDPVRTITATVNIDGRFEPLCVKTAQPVPKALIADAVAEIKALKLTPPVKAGETVCDNLCGMGISIIATNSVR